MIPLVERNEMSYPPFRGPDSNRATVGGFAPRLSWRFTAPVEAAQFPPCRIVSLPPPKCVYQMGFRRRKAGRDKDIGKHNSFHRPVKRIGPWHTRRGKGTTGAAGGAGRVAVPQECYPAARALEPRELEPSGGAGTCVPARGLV